MTYNFLTIPGMQYEKLHAILQLNFSMCKTAASQSDTLANHFIRSSDHQLFKHIQQSSVPEEINYMDEGWDSAHERVTQSTCLLYDMSQD